MYELAALGARYVFAGLMLLIVLRAWRITLIDSRRARTLRRMSPQTGLSGELVVLEGDGKALRGMKYPVIREGLIGSSRGSDIRIRHTSIRRRHAWFELGEDGLSLRANASAPMRDAEGRPARALTLDDGAEFSLGHVRLLLVLNEAPEPAHRRRGRRDEPDDDDDFPGAGAPEGDPREAYPDDGDLFFDSGDEDW